MDALTQRAPWANYFYADLDASERDMLLGNVSMLVHEGSLVWCTDTYCEQLAGKRILTTGPAVTAVSMRQARLALLDRGLLSQVDVAIDSLPSPQKEAARIEWEYAATVERGSVMVAMLSQALTLSSTDLDDIFQYASTL